MQMKNFLQAMNDGTEISVNRWSPDEKESIKAVIVLSHGMQEHAIRYDKTGSIFAENGYAFYAHDHRGHGKTAATAEKNGNGMFGLLAKKNGFNKVVSDLAEIIKKAKEEFPGKKIVLFGHSFGSFVAQAYIERYGDLVDGVILCGSSGPMNSLAKKGRAIVRLMSIFHRSTYKSKYLQRKMFETYLDKVENAKTELDWISKNSMNVEMYMNDAWCGGIATLGFWRDLMNGLIMIHSPKEMKKIPASLPVFIISGSEDPVGGYGKRVTELSEIYKANGMTSVALKLYEGDRHEILNEDDSDTVIADVEKWIEETVLA